MGCTDVMLTINFEYDIRVKCVVDSHKLFATLNEHTRFNARWTDFLSSDEFNRKVYSLTGDTLEYSFEQLIPTKIDKRPPVLLMQANPVTYQEFFVDVLGG